MRIPIPAAFAPGYRVWKPDLRGSHNQELRRSLLTRFGMVESTGKIEDQTTHETKYLISSSPCGGKWFAEAALDHCGVENSPHWCLGISFDEDNSRVRSGHATANLAVICSFSLSLIKQDPLRRMGLKADQRRAR